MTAAQYETSEILIDKVSDWLKQVSLRNTDLETVIRGCCERLAATGIPLKRIHISLSMLHPLYRAMGFTWRRGEGLKVEGYRHVEPGEEKNDLFLKSPYFHLLSHNLEHMRRRIDVDEVPEFPIFEDLRKEGITDYLAFVSGFDEEWTQGILGSWSTDRAGGFNESDIAGLLKIQSRLAVATSVSLDLVAAAASAPSSNVAQLASVTAVGTPLQEVKTSEVGTNVSLKTIETIPQLTRNFLEFADTVPPVPVPAEPWALLPEPAPYPVALVLP